jgi:predicted PurR-regulated permease PerM
MTELRSKLEQHLGQGILALLFIGCLLVLWPFVTALLWATVLSFSMWPLYSRLVNFLGGRRSLAALLLSMAMIVAVVLPLGMVGLTLGENVAELKSATRRILDEGVPAAPEWLEKVPLVGSAAKASWDNMASDSSKLTELAKSLIEPVGSWLLKAGLTLGSGLGQLALSVLLTFFLLRHGAASAANVSNGIRRIAGERGTHLLNVAGNTVRGVVYGILGTAIAQAVMAGFGFFIAGVPGAGLLAVIMFFVSVIPLGPPLIWLPAALWLFHQGATGWGVFMLVWGLGVSTLDNLVKPWLISQGSDLPFILILLGVLGGAFAFGFIGVFLGPTLLAVGYRILKEWSAAGRTSELVDSEDSERTSGPLAQGEALSKST